MGSYNSACITGFLCRLCSEIHRSVIHIYGEQGRRLQLAQKINNYLPVTISSFDPLPKTICAVCLKRVEQHHELMLKLQRNNELFSAAVALAARCQKAKGENSMPFTPIRRQCINDIYAAAKLLAMEEPINSVPVTEPVEQPSESSSEHREAIEATPAP